MTKIMLQHGFQEFRYVAGWCHTPNPDNVFEVFRHHDQFAIADPLLPKLPKKALYGVFRKTHLTTGCQLVKEGSNTFENSSELMCAAKANASLRDVLEHGIYMEVFDYKDVEAHRDEFTALMASDSFDSEMCMPEDEISIALRMHHAMRVVTPPKGQRQWQAVRRELLKYGVGDLGESDFG